MATTRKRTSSGFISDFPEEVKEDTIVSTEVHEHLEEGSAPLLLENFSNSFEEDREEKIFPVQDEIVPTDDSGPRFTETTEKVQEVRKARPHPRNIPRFSRLAK